MSSPHQIADSPSPQSRLGSDITHSHCEDIMSVNFDNLTGHESLAELEAALAAYDEHTDQEAASPVNTAVIATPSDETGEQTAPPAVSETVVVEQPEPASEPVVTPTPDRATAPAPAPDKVVLSKDGKHHIPYEVLEAERAQKQRLAAEKRASSGRGRRAGDVAEGPGGARD